MGRGRQIGKFFFYNFSLINYFINCLATWHKCVSHVNTNRDLLCNTHPHFYLKMVLVLNW